MPYSPPPEDMSTGEVVRLLARIEGRLGTIDKKLDARPTWQDIDRLQLARDAQLQAMQSAQQAEAAVLREDVTELQDEAKWSRRLIIGAVGIAALDLLLSAPPLP